MVEPFEQQNGDQGCPNLDAQGVFAGTDKGFHFEVLLESLEQLNDILPINNVLLKSRSTTTTIPCAHKASRWSGCMTSTTRPTMSCARPMARRWPCRFG